MDTNSDFTPLESSEVLIVNNLVTSDEEKTNHEYPFKTLDIIFGVALNIAGLSIALGWIGVVCFLPSMVVFILFSGNILKTKREEYAMRMGFDATRHPIGKTLYFLAIFSFLVGIILGMVTNYIIA